MPCGYFLVCSLLIKCGKTGRFSGRLRPDLGNNAQAAMAGSGSIKIQLTLMLRWPGFSVKTNLSTLLGPILASIHALK